jgi:hypothetical protein
MEPAAPTAMDVCVGPLPSASRRIGTDAPLPPIVAGEGTAQGEEVSSIVGREGARSSAGSVGERPPTGSEEDAGPLIVLPVLDLGGEYCRGTACGRRIISLASGAVHIRRLPT